MKFPEAYRFLLPWDTGHCGDPAPRRKREMAGSFQRGVQVILHNGKATCLSNKLDGFCPVNLIIGKTVEVS